MANRKNIRVEFIDVETGAMIGYDEQPAKKLPETFEFTTRVEIKGQKFEVVKAEPNQRKKYRKSRLLVLEVKEIRPEVAAPVVESGGEEAAPVSQGPVTYVQPSRADVFPAFSESQEGKDLLEIGMDHWRSVELLRESFEQDVLVEMSRIEVSEVNQKVESETGVRYRLQHRRSLIHTPFKDVSLEAGELSRTYFPFAMIQDGLTFAGAVGYAEGGFGLRTAGGIGLYGLEIRDQVVCMGLDIPVDKQPSLIRPDLNRLVQFMEAKKLILVDWDNYLVFHPDADGLEGLFGLQGTQDEEVEEVAAESVVGEVEPNLVEEAVAEAPQEGGILEDVQGMSLTASLEVEPEAIVEQVETAELEEFDLEKLPMQEFSVQNEEEE